MLVECINMFYIKNINTIGGTESFLYYLVKNYEDYDITIFYETADYVQLNRLQKYVRVKKYTDQKIKCKKAFFNYNLDIINNVEAEEYIQIIHTDKKYNGKTIKLNSKINRYLGVSKVVCEHFEELTGVKCELCYNPIFIEKPKKVLKLISATRLTAEKGKDRMIEFAKGLEREGIPYLWLIFTNDTKIIDNPNIIYMKPKMDIIDYIKDVDYLVQLSNQGEGYGYSIAESLSIGTPVICTPCDSFLEIGVKNNENGFIVDFDMKEINYMDIYKKRLKFDFKTREDNYKNILIKSKNTYKEDIKKMVEVKCIKKYVSKEGKNIKPGDIIEINKVRAEDLVERGLGEYL